MAVWIVTPYPERIAPLFQDLPEVRVLPPAGAVWHLAGGPPPRRVVNWGVLPGDDPGGTVLNRRTALAVLNHPAEVRRRLRLNGFRSLSRAEIHHPGAPFRIYRVALLDFQIYDLRRVTGRAGRVRTTARLGLGRRAQERVTGAAIRALHALGLEAGMVDVALYPGHNQVEPAVAGIRIGPMPGGGGLSRLKALLTRWGRGEGPGDGGGDRILRLGADPEFMLRHRLAGEPVPASAFFRRSGRVGCDTQGGRRSGEYPIAEVRPGPRRDPDRLLKELRRCMALAVRWAPYQDLEWVAGAEPFTGYPTGGHIHFSGIPLSGRLLRALDAYLAVPVFLVEPRERAVRRRLRHGFLGDVRLKGHGGFEYRTLPSWLVHPALARAVLHLAWLVATHAGELRCDPFLDGAMGDAFYRGDKTPFYELAPRLWDDLQGLPGFGPVGPALAPLWEMIAARRTWDDAADIRRAWRLPVGAAPYGRVRTATGA